MNKSELIKSMADKSGMSLNQSCDALEAMTDVLSTELASGGKIQLTGFGSFVTVDRAERTGRNPQTGEAITIPASRSVKFSPGKQLKEAVN